MHEYGMCEAIVDSVLQRAQGRTVAGVRVRVGRLQRVVPEAFVQAFALAAAGTPAADAVPELVFEAVRVRCRTCDTRHEGEDLLPSCPDCRSGDLELLGGDELVVESIRYDRAGT